MFYLCQVILCCYVKIKPSRVGVGGGGGSCPPPPVKD